MNEYMPEEFESKEPGAWIKLLDAISELKKVKSANGNPFESLVFKEWSRQRKLLLQHLKFPHQRDQTLQLFQAHLLEAAGFTSEARALVDPTAHEGYVQSEIEKISRALRKLDDDDLAMGEIQEHIDEMERTGEV